MALYSERHGFRKPIERTYEIDKINYSILIDTCLKYKNNLIHLFNFENYDGFTQDSFIDFNETQFLNNLKVEIPNLFDVRSEIILEPNSNNSFDQYALIDLIEYIGSNIKDIESYWNNERYKNYKIINPKETDNIYNEFQTKINKIFDKSGILYILTDNKIIERIIENDILDEKMEIELLNVNEKGTKELLIDAISLYRTPNPACRQDSVEKLWDAFERLKTYYTTMKKNNSVDKITTDMSNSNPDYKDIFDNEFKYLTTIGNDYRIRHHETYKKEIPDPNYYDYLFGRCISLISLAIKYLK